MQGDLCNLNLVSALLTTIWCSFCSYYVANFWKKIKNDKILKVEVGRKAYEAKEHKKP